MFSALHRLQKNPGTIANGCLHMPDLPGLGAEIDEEALLAYSR